MDLPVAIIIGVVAGLVTAAILALTTDKCQHCNWRLRKGQAVCGRCGRPRDGQ